MAETTNRHIVSLLGAAALLAMLLLVISLATSDRSSAQEPTPTVTELMPPAAPDLVEFDDRLRWIDNSDNEDGFRILITVNGEEHVFEVGENVTVFGYPDGLIPSCGTTDYELTAFNTAGETRATSSSFLISDCFIGVNPEVLPETGHGGLGAFPFTLVLAALAGAAGLTLISAASLSLRRR